MCSRIAVPDLNEGVTMWGCVCRCWGCRYVSFVFLSRASVICFIMTTTPVRLTTGVTSQYMFGTRSRIPLVNLGMFQSMSPLQSYTRFQAPAT